MSGEIWKDVVDPFWCKYYEVSSSGKFRSKDREVRSRHGTIYLAKGSVVRLNKVKTRNKLGSTFSVTINGIRKCTVKYIRREVALAFVEKPEPVQAISRRNKGSSQIKDHEYIWTKNIDGDYTNNFDWNIQWITARDKYFEDSKGLREYVGKQKKANKQ